MAKERYHHSRLTKVNPTLKKLHKSHGPFRGPAPRTMALANTKGFASFTEKGKNEQKSFLRGLGTGMHHQPWGKKRKSKGQNQCSGVESGCIEREVFWLRPGKHTGSKGQSALFESVLPEQSYECVSAHGQNCVSSLCTENCFNFIYIWIYTD